MTDQIIMFISQLFNGLKIRQRVRAGGVRATPWSPASSD